MASVVHHEGGEALENVSGNEDAGSRLRVQ